MLDTKADLLGWEGMRLRVAVREAQERNALEASSSPSVTPTPGASATRPIPLVSHSHFRFSSPIDIVFHILPLQFPFLAVALVDCLPESCQDGPMLACVN